MTIQIPDSLIIGSEKLDLLESPLEDRFGGSIRKPHFVFRNTGLKRGYWCGWAVGESGELLLTSVMGEVRTFHEVPSPRGWLGLVKGSAIGRTRLDKQIGFIKEIDSAFRGLRANSSPYWSYFSFPLEAVVVALYGKLEPRVDLGVELRDATSGTGDTGRLVVYTGKQSACETHLCVRDLPGVWMEIGEESRAAQQWWSVPARVIEPSFPVGLAPRCQAWMSKPGVQSRISLEHCRLFIDDGIRDVQIGDLGLAELPAVADWFTGQLRVGLGTGEVGKLSDTALLYDRYLILTVVHGAIIDRMQVDERPTDVL